MWIEILIGLVVWTVFIWLLLKTVESIKLKRQKRRYKEEDDIGRKYREESGVGFRTSGIINKGEPELQGIGINEQPKLFQSGVSGIPNDIKQSDSDAEYNHRY